MIVDIGPRRRSIFGLPASSGLGTWRARDSREVPAVVRADGRDRRAERHGRKPRLLLPQRTGRIVVPRLPALGRQSRRRRHQRRRLSIGASGGAHPADSADGGSRSLAPGCTGATTASRPTSGTTSLPAPAPGARHRPDRARFRRVGLACQPRRFQRPASPLEVSRRGLGRQAYVTRYVQDLR